MIIFNSSNRDLSYQVLYLTKISQEEDIFSLSLLSLCLLLFPLFL